MESRVIHIFLFSYFVTFQNFSLNSTFRWKHSSRQTIFFSVTEPIISFLFHLFLYFIPLTLYCMYKHTHTESLWKLQLRVSLCVYILHVNVRLYLFPQVYCSHHYDWWGLWLPYKAPCPGGLRRGEDHLPLPIHRQQVQPQVHYHSGHRLQGKESGELRSLHTSAF